MAHVLGEMDGTAYQAARQRQKKEILFFLNRTVWTLHRCKFSGNTTQNAKLLVSFGATTYSKETKTYQVIGISGATEKIHEATAETRLYT